MANTFISEIAGIKEHISLHWGDRPCAIVANRILDALHEKEMDVGDQLTMSSFLEMLDMPEVNQELVAAWAILVQSTHAVFNTFGKYVEGNEEYRLSPQDFDKARKGETIKHPGTGKEIKNPGKYLIPVFEITLEHIAFEAERSSHQTTN